MLFFCPSCEGDLRFKIRHHKGCPEQGEHGYSLGQPAEPAYTEVFSTESCPHCDYVFTDADQERFEEEASQPE